MESESVLFPPFDDIEINERNYRIGKISISQLAAITNLLAKVFSSIVKAINEYKKKVDEGTTVAADIGFLLTNISPEDLTKLLSIILKENDLAFLADMPWDKAFDVMALLVKHNDLDLFKKKALVILELTTKTLEEKKN